MPDLPFHPLINTWFSETYGKPTAVQAEAWPLIGRGEHVLALAPTGSGKTLTAFLGAISRFVQGSYPADVLTVLYVSPLKALNEDIRRNLLEPIAALQARFEREGQPFPDIRVETRSGDTTAAQRRRFAARPPAILATTPESLAILLLSDSGRAALKTLRYVILDEIHTALGSKRGAFLACQIDRLALLAGEFQRVALSATVRLPERAAEFAGGFRPVQIVSPPAEKRIELRVEYPPLEPGLPEPGKRPDAFSKRYAVLVDIILERIRRPDRAGRAILVFTDSRRRAERIAFLVNQAAEEELVFVHHGSLAPEVRRAVEKRLAAGEIPCVAATGSLELGIDIGAVEEVILAGSPAGAATALQRIGRAGHGVGLVSRALLVPFHGLDLVQTAALAGAVADREIEETAPVDNPLDVLAQIILALCIEKPRIDTELYELIRGFRVFRSLDRASFDAVAGMLAGYSFPAAGPGKTTGSSVAGDRVRELRPLLYRDEASGELSASAGARFLLYLSGGVIASRGYYAMRLAGGARIGELDEEFVWERRLGDHFEFGARSWVITAIGPEAVTVVPRGKPSGYAPFWKADAAYRSPVLSRRVLELFEAYNRGGSPALPALSDDAATALGDFLSRQERAQGGCALPSGSFFPIEIIEDPGNQRDIRQVILHTFRGEAVNYPLSMALAQEFEDRSGSRVEVQADDNGILLFLVRTGAVDPEEAVRGALLSLAGDGSRAEVCFRRRLETSGVFGAAFRETAERSLLLPRASFGKRTPLWVLRRRAKDLYDRVAGQADFPVTVEAWRSCLRDQFDMPGFAAFFADIGTRALGFAFFRSHRPSPFAEHLVWITTGALLYEYDERPDLRERPGGTELSNESWNVSRDETLGDRVIREALNNGARRPVLPAGLVADFSARLRRELPDWAPQDELSLAEWVKERIAIPRPEWETLSRALPEPFRQVLAADPHLGGRLYWVGENLVHRDRREVWAVDSLACLGPWLRCQGPVPVETLATVFGAGPAEISAAAEALASAGELVLGVSVADAGSNLVCDRKNLEILLRLSRKGHPKRISEKPAALLLPFLALRQGIAIHRPGETLRAPAGDSFAFPPALAGYALPAEIWERDILAVRFPGYRLELLDRELEAGKLLWYGAGREKIAFAAPDDLALILDPGGPPFEGALPGDFLDTGRDFWDIKERLGGDSPSTAARLWEEVWKGRLSAESFEPLRRALTEGFIPRDLARFAGERRTVPVPGHPAGRLLPRAVPRALRNRWRGGPPVAGKWFALGGGLDGEDWAGEPDLLDEESLNRERVLFLLRRWGLLTRPLLEREAPALSWSALLPAIRRLELAGELMAGRFFGGVNSLQFAPPDIAEALEQAGDERGIYWMNAADPASPAGLDIDGMDGRLPVRIASARFCCRGSTLAAVSCRNGRELRVLVPPGDADLPLILGFLRPPEGGRKLVVETINGISAARSEYTGALRTLGFFPDRNSLVYWPG
ncbi:MAG: DEAD/DEAH box helicase [Treponema sp.]|jgi:ATP-dependent Lhr-like helicase|nr:DEAD/DEAH box helicase [Treponema sp.]